MHDVLHILPNVYLNNLKFVKISLHELFVHLFALNSKKRNYFKDKSYTVIIKFMVSIRRYIMP